MALIINHPLRLLRLCLTALVLLSASFWSRCTRSDGSIRYAWQSTFDCPQCCQDAACPDRREEACPAQEADDERCPGKCVDEIIAAAEFTAEAQTGLVSTTVFILSAAPSGFAAPPALPVWCRNAGPSTGPPCPSCHLELVSGIQQLI